MAVVLRSDGLASHHQLSVSFVLPDTKPFARCDVWSARPACGDADWFDPNAGPQSCDAHSQCAALGLRGACCPSADGPLLAQRAGVVQRQLVRARDALAQRHARPPEGRRDPEVAPQPVARLGRLP